MDYRESPWEVLHEAYQAEGRRCWGPGFDGKVPGYIADPALNPGGWGEVVKLSFFACEVPHCLGGFVFSRRVSVELAFPIGLGPGLVVQAPISERIHFGDAPRSI